MTPQALAAIASAILSLLFSYVPGFQTWYDPLSATFKRLVMLTLVAFVSIGAFGAACAGWGDQLNIDIVCDQFGALGLLQTLVAAIAANQATFLISPQPAGKKVDPVSVEPSSPEPFVIEAKTLPGNQPVRPAHYPHKIAPIKRDQS